MAVQVCIVLYGITTFLALLGDFSGLSMDYDSFAKQVNNSYALDKDITNTARRVKATRLEVIEAVGLSDFWASIYWNEEDDD